MARATRFANLDVVPSRPELAGAVVELSQHGDGETFLAPALEPARERYDYAFVDCPPSASCRPMDLED